MGRYSAYDGTNSGVLTEHAFICEWDTVSSINQFKNNIYGLQTQNTQTYTEAATALRNELEKLTTNPPEGISLEDIFAAQNHLDNAQDYLDKAKAATDILGYIENLEDGMKLLSDLNTTQIATLIDWSAYNAAKGQHQQLVDWVTANINNADNYPHFKAWLDSGHTVNDLKAPDIADFTSYYTKMDKLNDIKNSGATFGDKFKQVGTLIDSDTTFSFKNAWNGASKWEKAGVIMSVVNVGLNVVDSRNEIGTALDEASKADLLDKWHVFSETLKAQPGEKYDKLNLSVIDAVGAGVGLAAGGVLTTALATLGAPVVLAGLGASLIVAGGTALAKTVYSTAQHKDADFWKTLGKNLNPFDAFSGDGSTYVQKNPVELNDVLFLSDVSDVVNDVTTISGTSDADALFNDGKNFVVILGYEGDDFLVNQDSENVTISGGSGNDSIINSNSSNVTINGGAGSNTIRNFDSRNVLIIAQDGSDYIDNAGNGNTIDAGDGNNFVDNIGAGVLIQTGSGSDTISSFGVQVEIDAGAGDDDITTEGDSVTASAGEGNDSLQNLAGSAILIDMGAGADFVESFGSSNTILAGADDDIINSVGDGNLIDAGLGDDYVENIGNSNTITGGAGDDYILSVGDKNFIDAGDDNDYIVNFGNDNTLDGSAGNDIIDLQENFRIVIKYTAGDDYVYGFNDTSTLSIGGSYSKETVGSDVLIKVGDGSVLLKGAATLATINIDGDEISNGKFIVGTTGRDTLTGTDYDDTIDGGAGRDVIYGGAGDDSLNGGGANDKIYGQDGDDTIIGGTGYDTFYGGAGNDLFVFTAGADVIADYALGDKISIGSEITSATLSGSNVVFKTAAGTLTVNNAKDLTLNLIDADGNDYSTVIGGGKFIVGTTGKDTLRGTDYDDTIDSGAGRDVIYGGLGDDSLNGGGANDKIYGQDGSDTLWGGTGNDTLYGGAGSDKFIFSAGADTIVGFENDDLLQIMADNYSAAYSSSAKTVTFTASTGSITLKDFTATTFRVNDDTWQLSGNSFTKK